MNHKRHLERLKEEGIHLSFIARHLYKGAKGTTALMRLKRRLETDNLRTHEAQRLTRIINAITKLIEKL